MQDTLDQLGCDSEFPVIPPSSFLASSFPSLPPCHPDRQMGEAGAAFVVIFFSFKGSGFFSCVSVFNFDTRFLSLTAIMGCVRLGCRGSGVRCVNEGSLLSVAATECQAEIF